MCKIPTNMEMVFASDYKLQNELYSECFIINFSFSLLLIKFIESQLLVNIIYIVINKYILSVYINISFKNNIIETVCHVLSSVLNISVMY